MDLSVPPWGTLGPAGLLAVVVGLIVTGRLVQARFAQNVSNATALLIKRGSWLRLVKVA